MTQRYLIVEPIGVIAEDLAMSIRDHDPAAEVLLAAKPATALAMMAEAVMAGSGGVRLALVHADPGGFADTELGRALHGLGARVVFIGDRAERAARRVPQFASLHGAEATDACPPRNAALQVLDSPFSTQSVLALLQRIDGGAT